MDHTYDLIIIGAGINGAGIARDAACRGLRTLLLDKGDVASGTSAYSTRLIHGGLRYLEYGEIHLVRQSLREREILLRLAPHLVRPLPLLIPIYAGGRRGPWTIAAGMLTYDILSYDKSLPPHRILSRRATLQRLPEINASGLRGSALYYDAQVQYAERLVVENALSAQQAGAEIRTYCRMDRLLLEGSRVVGVEFRDLLTGQTDTARGRVTLNCAGPWVDQVLGNLSPSSPRLIGGTKGSHIVVDPFPGAPPHGLYTEARHDGRPFFILPWTGRYLIGTTDLRFDLDPDQAQATPAEIDYLLAETNHLIPIAALTRPSVLCSYSGVRPLPYVPAGKEAAITRRHLLHDHAPQVGGLISIIGGKLTTYRALAEEAVDAVYTKLGLAPPPCSTAHLPLPGASGGFAKFHNRFLAESRLPPRTATHLVDTYGTRATDILALASTSSDLLQVLDPDTGAIAAEIVFALQHELARTLPDILLRRTMIGLGPTLGLNAAPAAAGIASRYLGWDRNRVSAEIDAYLRSVERFRSGTECQRPTA